MNGRVEASSPEVHHLLQRHAPELNQRLQEMNIKLDNLEFSLMNSESGPSGQGSSPHSGGGKSPGSPALSGDANPAAFSDEKSQNRLMFDYSTFEYIA